MSGLPSSDLVPHAQDGKGVANRPNMAAIFGAPVFGAHRSSSGERTLKKQRKTSSRGRSEKDEKSKETKVARAPIPREPIPREAVTHTDRSFVPEATIDKVIALVRKEHGEHSIARLSDYEPTESAFPLPLANMTYAIGVPGFPRAKLVQIYGPPSAGKTTLAKIAMAAAQQQGYVVHHWDRENSLDPVRDAKLGVRIDNVLYHDDALTIEDAFSEIMTVIAIHKKLKTPAFLVLDSVAAYMTKADIERPFDQEARRAALASFLSQNLKKLLNAFQDENIAVLFVNQQRSNANASSPWAKQTYAPGGNALHHFCHLTIEMKHIRILKHGSGEAAEPVGITARGRVEKSKLSTPFKTFDINIYADRVEEATREPVRD